MQQMRQMFESATVKLTAWYVLILMTISILFSGIVFELSTREISNRLQTLQLRLEGNREITFPGTFSFNDIRQRQTSEAEVSMFFALFYINVAILLIGSIGGYLLARRTLRPIEAAHEAQSRFTSDASHEFKTPLAVMKSEIEVGLRDAQITKEELRELLTSNLEEVEKLNALSHNLLRLSRLDYSDIEKNERVDVYGALTAAKASLGKQHSRIQCTPPKQPIIIDGNSSMIQELYSILLDNALKYSPVNSIINTSVTANGRSCIITVSNSGAGIAAKDIPHIFDRFYRADRSRTSHGQQRGYGLGLSLAKQIVTFHDGQISVHSDPNSLTTFRVTLPQVQKNR